MGARRLGARWVVLASLWPLGAGRNNLPRPGPAPEASIRFEKNEGQFDPEVAYSARLDRGQLFLTARQAALSTGSTALGMVFEGARGDSPDGEGLLPSWSNYYLGNDPARWRTGVPAYRAVRYREAWPGIDIVFHGDGRGLEYDFFLAPGADPDAIRLAFRGADAVDVDPRGDLRVRVSGGEVLHSRPRIFEEGRSIAGAFSRLSETEVAFALGERRPGTRLLIDPSLIYSTYLGGNLPDYALGVAVDPSGNAHLVGQTGSANFPTTVGSSQPASRGGSDVFLVKLGPGGALLYSTYLGGSLNDYGYAVATNPAGDSFLTGNTQSADFPTLGAPQPILGGGYDAFVAKFDGATGQLVYSTFLGGSGDEVGFGIAADSSGSPYVTGSTKSLNFPVTLLAFQRQFDGGTYDAFVTKLTPDGGQLAYSTYLGGQGDDVGNAIAVDAQGSAYLTGYTSSLNFPLVTPAQGVFGGIDDAFVTKLSPAGDALSYSTYLGGNQNDFGYGIALDAAESAYVTGSTNSTNFPVVGPFQATYDGGFDDAFVTKLTNDGRAMVYSTYLGGNGDDIAYGIAVDSSGDAVVAGYTASLNFPVINALQGALDGGIDAFVTELSASGAALTFSTYLGGPGTDVAYGVAVDPSGNAYAVGYVGAATFPTVNAAQAIYGGGTNDGFGLKLTLPIVVSDAGGHDSGSSDAGQAPLDSGGIDRGAPADSGGPDGGSADGGALDAGSHFPRALEVGCGCGASRPGSLLLVALLALSLAGRRRGPGPPHFRSP